MSERDKQEKWEVSPHPWEGPYSRLSPDHPLRGLEDELNGWKRHAQTSDREVWNLRLTLGTIYVTWEERSCSIDAGAPCVFDPDRTDESMCDRCWIVELIGKSLPEPALMNTLQAMADLAEGGDREAR